MVIATQNPFEFEGTYPLPESQLDRFLMRISIGYPDREDELQVLNSHRAGEPVDDLQAVIDVEQVLALQEAVRQVAVDASIQEYLLDIVQATRQSARADGRQQHARRVEPVPRLPGAGAGRGSRLRRARRRQAVGRAGAGPPRHVPRPRPRQPAATTASRSCSGW